MAVEIAFEDDSGVLNSIVFDAGIAERIEMPSLVTEHPVVEDRAVTDHVRAEADTISITAVVSNHPIGSPPAPNQGASGAVSTLRLDTKIKQPRILRGLNTRVPSSVSVLQFDAEFDRVQAVHDILRQLRSEGRIIRVITSLREYPSMVISGIAFSRNKDNAHSITFEIACKQIRQISTIRVDLEPIPEEPRAEPEQNRGDQAAEEQKPQQQSMLRRVLEWTGI